MSEKEFEQFVLEKGRDILRFCRMIAQDGERGSELYQDTMLRLLEKRKKLDPNQNVKSYALSVSMMLWKNKKKKYAVRDRIAPMFSIEGFKGSGRELSAKTDENSAEEEVMSRMEQQTIRRLVAQLPEKYRQPILLSYAADMKIVEIAEFLQIPEGTVKTHLHKAKQILKKQLEEIEYDR